MEKCWQDGGEAGLSLRCSHNYLSSGERRFWGRQMDCPASNHEHAFPLVMNRPWSFPCRVNPRKNVKRTK
jgi:hypothetical protein